MRRYHWRGGYAKRKILDSKMYEKIGELLEEQLTQNCMEAISICIEDNHSDIFNFGRRLYQSQPTYWKQHEANWREEMDQAEYDVQVEVQLRAWRPGNHGPAKRRQCMTSHSLGIPVSYGASK